MFTLEFMFAKMVLPTAGRIAFGLEHVPGVLSGRFDGRLPLCSLLAEVAWPAAAVLVAHRAFVRGLHRLADRRGPRLDAAQREQPHPLAPDAADDLRGAAVFLHFGQRAVVAGLVRPVRRAGGKRPLFSLRRQQSRQPRRIGGLSALDRAAPAAGLANAIVVRRLRAAHGPLRTLRGRGVDRRKASGGGRRAGRPGGRGACSIGRRCFASRRFPCAGHAAPPPLVAGAVAGAFGVIDGRHGAPCRGYAVDAVVVGHSAGAVPALVHHGFRPLADLEVALAVADLPGRRTCRRGGHGLRGRAGNPRHRGRRRTALGGLLSHRAGVSRGDGRRPPGEQALDRILPLDVGRRRRRRPDLRRWPRWSSTACWSTR